MIHGNVVTDWIYNDDCFYEQQNDMHGYYRKNGSETQQVVYQNGYWANENRHGTYQNHINYPNAVQLDTDD